MKVIVVNDVHLSDKAPKWRRDTYAQEILEKLRWVVSYANSTTATLLAFTGDVFHNPVPNRVSHFLVGQFIDTLLELECPVVFVSGNHDMGSGGIDTIDRQPLGIVVKALPNAELLSSKSGTRWFGGGYTVRGIEWSYNYDEYEYLVGHGYTTEVDLLLMHAPIAKRSNPHYETIDPAKLAQFSKCVAFGHLHPPEEPYVIEGTLFVNPGALSRGSLTLNDINRTPQIAVIEFNAGRNPAVHYVSVGCAKPAEEIFHIQQALFEKDNNAATDKFVASLNAASLDRMDLDSLIKASAIMTDDRAVAEYCREILTSVGE